VLAQILKKKGELFPNRPDKDGFELISDEQGVSRECSSFSSCLSSHQAEQTFVTIKDASGLEVSRSRRRTVRGLVWERPIENQGKDERELQVEH
jgi:hypothetical protein